MMDFHKVRAHVESYITHMQEVISKVLLDQITLVTTTDHKLVNAMGAKDFENVPQNWLSANLNHGFWFDAGFFADASSKATGKNNSFHGFSN
jgi:hypothetical protein